MTAKPLLVTVDHKFRKTLGIFYTPSEVTKILADWVIRGPKDTIFEPSFGGCGFLESSCNRLESLGSTNPITQIYGCDIDKNAFDKYLLPKYQKYDHSVLDRFVEKDFLNLTASDFGINKFSGILGNPPYISHHNMSEQQRQDCRKTAKRLGVTLSSRSSLWAYFVIQGLSFLEEGGRAAWVLPGSFLHAFYSTELKEIIAQNFQRSIVVQLGQKIFASAGTDENTAILLADGYNLKSSENSLKVTYAQDTINLQDTVELWQAGKIKGSELTPRVNHSLLNPDVTVALQQIEKERLNIPINDIAHVLIGVVTGSNKFFVVNQETVSKWNLSENNLTKIFSRFRFAEGISLESHDLKVVEEANYRCLLVDSSKDSTNLALKVYLWSFPEKEKLENVTFQKRSIWHQPLDTNRIPNAFFSYMHHEGPRLILNNAGVISTNTIHRIFFKDQISVSGRKKESQLSTKERKLAAISILTTYSQLSAEIEGRVYGSGVLKHEPSEVKKIRLLWENHTETGKVAKVFDKIDKMLRENNPNAARKEADKFFLGSQEFKDELSILDKTLIELRQKRYGKGQTKL